MPHVDEGLIHAWIEDQLSPEEAARVERLVATDAAWGAAAAEARGLIAASSRLLGALDSAPSARERHAELAVPNVTARKGGNGLARNAWLRVAAAVVLVAGVSGILFTGGEDNVTAFSDVPNQVRETPPVVQERAVTSPMATASQAAANPAPPTARTEAQRDTSTRARDARAELPPAGPPAAPPPPVVIAPPAAALARDEVARAASGVVDTVIRRSVTGAAGGRGGRALASGSGRAGEQSNFTAQKSSADLSDAAQTLGSQRADSIVNTCWMPQDAVNASERRAMNESDRSVTVLLRFVPPIVTDVGLPAVSAARAASPAPAQLQAAPSAARVQHTTARAKDDSTLVAEWLNPDARRTQLTFRITNDTLRGTTSTIVGGVVTPAGVFVAVQVRCPQ